MNCLLDSDWVIDHLKGIQSIIDSTALLLPNGVGISLISYGEIYDGVLHSRDPNSAETAFHSVLQWTDVVALDEAIMRRFASIRGDLRRRGLKLPDADLMIAATALHLDLTLVTRNRKHFERIDELKLYPSTPSGM